MPPSTNRRPYDISSAGYTIAKTLADPTNRPIVIDDIVRFEVRIVNTGDVALVTVPVTDVYETVYLTYTGAVPASVDNVNDGLITWTDVGPLPVGASTTLLVYFRAAAATSGLRTNTALTAPTTPPGEPPVPPLSSNAVYQVFSKCSIGNFVWLDVNGNGVQDGGSETGLPGVVVSLYTNGTVVGVTTTAANGAYAFTNLVPGTYSLGFAPPAGYALTLADQGGDDNLDSDANRVTGRTSPTVLTPAEDDLSWDAGLYVPASLGDFVWNDLDADGIQDAGETGVANVVVTLYSVSNGLIGVATTTVSGAYAFTNLPPDDYYVDIDTPSGWYVSPQFQGGNSATDSDIDGAGVSVIINLISGQTDLTLDAGIYVPASLGDFVWLDINGNGVQSGGSETGLPGVVVTLYDAATNVMGVTTTAVNGAYAFTNLVPSTYFVGFARPAGYQLTLRDVGADTTDSDPDRTTGYTIPTVLISGENDPTWDAGLYVPASLGNFVWDDTNGNGVQDVGETGVPDIVVTLYTNGTAVGVTTTDVTGVYAFLTLVPDTYSVGFAPPSGWQLTLRDVGADTADSDPDRTTGRTIATVLTSGENDPTWDAGLYRPAALGNFIWHDLDADGIQDGGETGVANVVVDLHDTNGIVVGTTTTDVNGIYWFTNLPPADYYIDVDVPPAWFTSPPDQGGDDTLDNDIDSAGTTGTRTLVSGQTDPDVDGGLYLPASLGDFVWLDVNGNGVQDGGSETGLPGVVVTVYDADTNALDSTATDANGAYAFTNLVPATYFVGFATPAGYRLTLADQGGDSTDSDANRTTGRTIPTVLTSGENDVTWDAGLYAPASLGNFVWVDSNGDGLQDVGEPGLAGVTVRLYDADTNLLDSTATDASGFYAFTNLLPATYLVRFELPTGYRFTPSDLGGDTVDSDAAADGFAPPVTLVSGESNLTIDAGVYIPAQLGDRAWEDLNGNGIQDAGEPGIAGVTVTLYYGLETWITSTVTDASGYYLFTNLLPGAYYVNFETPAGHEVTGQDQGSNDAADSDIVPATGNTATYMLLSAQSDLTVDAGFFRPASLGDRVWEDLDYNGVQDTNEVASAAVTSLVVRLYSGAGSLLDTTLTDTNGNYAFTNLPPGSYFVEFTSPTSHIFVLANQGTNDTLDSDANPATARSHIVTLASGDDNTTVDAGIIGTGIIGDHVWYDINGDGLQDEDPLLYGLNGIRVYLFRIVGGITSLVSTVSTTNGAAGDYGFYVFPNLPFGTYRVQVETADLPGGLQLPTTVLEYFVTLKPDYIYYQADFGFVGRATPVTLQSFTAARTDGGVFVRWQTGTEVDNLGFNVYRSDSADGPKTRLNQDLIPGLGTASGQDYELTDVSAAADSTYYYWLEDVSLRGQTELHGPAVVAGADQAPSDGAVLSSFQVSRQG
ncbi:MAG: hypothetical protein BWK77_08380, partial [Verrucomicrobia bacterium A1]